MARCVGTKGGYVTAYLNDVDFDALADVNERAKLAKDLRTARQEYYADHPPAKAQVMLTRASDIVAEPIVWLWPGWLPAGKLSIIAGSPGTGKTTLALAMASIVTTGGAWPDGAVFREPGNVLMWSSEDDPADTLVPRLMAAGANRERFYFVDQVTDTDGELMPFDPSVHIDLLASRLEAIGGARLIIIDPLVSAVSGDAHRVNDVRRNLQPIVDLAARYRCAVLGISHFAKGTKGSSPAERVVGSGAFVALARMLMVAGKDETAERRILARAKSNIAPDDGGMAYAIEMMSMDGLEASRVIWGGMIEGSAREILGKVEQDDEERSERDDASDFLIGQLSEGPVPVKMLQQEARGAGLAWRTIERAKRALGIEARKIGMGSGWFWAMPPEVRHEEDEDRRTPNGGGLRESWRSSATTRVSGEVIESDFPEGRQDRHEKGSGGVRQKGPDNDGSNGGNP